VKLGLGLHMGYAIEGAIGSYYKIDASYLSPNVNMAARLEAGTKAYGVPILISGAIYKYFTQATKDQCRQVDYVTMAGND
jgi:class 3 adenylate cyclase